MSLPELRLSGLVLTPATAPAVARTWSVGQVLDALVTARAPDTGSLTLRIGTTTIEARSELPLQPGQSVKLEVTSAANPVVLRVVTPADTEAATLQQALRARLPRQSDLAPLLDTLVHLSTPPCADSGALPATILTAVQQLVAQLPRPEALASTASLKQALASSGTFFESALATREAPPGADFKAALLQLQAQLQSETAQGGSAATAALLRQVEGALARVELNQLHSTTTLGQTPTPLIVEIPVRDGNRADVLRLTVEADARQAGGEEQAAHAWTVWVELAPGKLGPVRARIGVAGETASVSFWAEHEQTARLFRKHIGELETALAAAGLRAGALNSFHGMPPQPPAARPPHGILDERA
jgi:hypothetical protein